MVSPAASRSSLAQLSRGRVEQRRQRDGHVRAGAVQNGRQDLEAVAGTTLPVGHRSTLQQGVATNLRPGRRGICTAVGPVSTGSSDRKVVDSSFFAIHKRLVFQGFSVSRGAGFGHQPATGYRFVEVLELP
jgi:hypothetical protein